MIVGSPNVNPGYRLVNNKAYPQIADDYERTFRVLKSLPCDLFLGAHGNYFDLEDKYARMKLTKPGVANPLIDPEGYKKFVTQKEREFRTELAKQCGLRRDSGFGNPCPLTASACPATSCWVARSAPRAS